MKNQQDSPTPPLINYASPGGKERREDPYFSRRTIKAFVIAAGIVALADVLLLSLLGPNVNGGPLWFVVNLPSLPCMFGCVMAAPPPMGESETGFWDYAIAATSMVISCIAWGTISSMIVNGLHRSK